MTKRFLVAAFIGVVWFLTFAYLPYYTLQGLHASFGSWTMLETAAFAGNFSAGLCIYIFGPAIILSALFNLENGFQISIAIYILNMLYAWFAAGFSSQYELLYGFYIHFLIMLFLPLIVGASIFNYKTEKSVAMSNENSTVVENNNIEKNDAVENLEKKVNINSTISISDELMKYASLKEAGHITQEEYDKKKKELLS